MGCKCIEFVYGEGTGREISKDARRKKAGSVNAYELSNTLKKHRAGVVSNGRVLRSLGSQTAQSSANCSRRVTAKGESPGNGLRELDYNEGLANKRRLCSRGGGRVGKLSFQACLMVIGFTR